MKRRYKEFPLLLLLQVTFCLSFSLVSPIAKPISSGSESAVAPPLSPSPASSTELLILSRKIKKCKSAEQALSFVSNIPPQLDSTNANDEPFVAAMSVFSKERRPDLAISLYNNMCRTESCRTWAISICGKNGRKEDALRLLSFGSEPPNVASYNSAIAACNDRESWKDALSVLNRMPSDLITNLSCNAVLTCLASAKQGEESRKLLLKMEHRTDYPNPDLISYHRTINALIWSKDANGAFEVLQEMEESAHEKAVPISETYDMIANAFGKAGNWTMANQVEACRLKRMKQATSGDSKTRNDADLSERQYYCFEHWDCKGLNKVKGEKFFHWEVGMYTSKNWNITIALQPHKNPSKNGMKLLFFDNGDPGSSEPQKQTKIGYLLMINSPSPDSGRSTFLGMFLSPTLRGGGLSKICLAMWMHFCLQSNIKPVTGIMNKPLLALVLQHKFGYVPIDAQQGLDAEISSGEEGKVLLYGTRSLAGAFSSQDLRHQNLVLSKFPANPRGRLTRVRAALQPQDSNLLRQTVAEILVESKGYDGFSYDITHEDLRRVLLGR